MIINYFKESFIDDNNVKIINTLCKEIHSRIPLPIIENKLFDHPNNGTLLAIYDALISLGFKTEAYNCELKYINNLSDIFIAQLTYQGNPYFSLVNRKKDVFITTDRSGNKTTKTIDDFSKIWTGNVLAIDNEKSNIKIEESSKTIQKKERFISFISIVGIIIFSYLFYSYPINYFSDSNILFYMLYLLVKVAGIGISAILIINEVHKDSIIGKKFCDNYGKYNCSAVTDSKISKKISEYISLSQIGLVYFLSTTFFIALSFLNIEWNNIVFFVSILSSILIIPSIIYQKFYVKQWCSLCLIIQTILFLETILVIFNNKISYDFNIDSILVLILISIVSVLIIRSIIPLIEGNKKYKKIKKSHSRFKLNKQVFYSLLHNGNKVKSNPCEIGILLNRNAKHDIIKVCNPFCGPCSDIHPKLHKLLSENKINLRIIFTIPLQIETIAFKIVAHFILLGETDKETLEDALNYWYSGEKNYDDFSNTFPVQLNSLNLKELEVQEMYSWSHENYVSRTPTIFLNGHKLPKEYEVEDLYYLLED